jgi:CPA2 family monovalent cation:H+ antiporter-2
VRDNGVVDHSTALIETIAIGLGAAFVGGLLARRLRLPTIVGYLLAGVAVGPFTPGLVANAGTATELAELGVILLMFGVGIHFSIPDLLAVRGVAIPGAVGQILVATLLGAALGSAIGLGLVGGIVLGLALSVASTVVLLRSLGERDELDTPQGRIAVGWLIVEDLFTVLVLVLLPTIAPILLGQAEAGLGATIGPLVVALVKVAIFAVLMLVLGVRIVPRLLEWVARDGSRELFTLSVLAIAIGIAFAAYAVFGVSFALGAFLAGIVLNESEISHRAAEDALPLRDAFAVLFFVSVGMLLDPGVLVREPFAILAVVLLIVVAKSVAAFLIVAALRQPVGIGLTVAAALGQIARAHPAGRLPARRRRRSPVDHAQPVPVPTRRAGDSMVPGAARAPPTRRGRPRRRLTRRSLREKARAGGAVEEPSGPPLRRARAGTGRRAR